MVTLTPEQMTDAGLMAEGDTPNFSLPGTGKTLTALKAHDITGNARALVMCPPIAMYMWQQEAEQFLGVKADVLTKNRNVEPGSDFVIVPYDRGVNMAGYLKQVFDTGHHSLILDESHYARGYTTKRARTIYGPELDGHHSLIEYFDNVWQLTGTPIYRYADDLYTQLAALFPAALAKYKAHTFERFCLKFTRRARVSYHSRMREKTVVQGNQNEKLLQKLVYGEIGAIRRSTIENLPDLNERKVFISSKPNKTLANILGKLSDKEIERILGGTLIEGDDVKRKDNAQQLWQAHVLGRVKDTSAYVADACMHGPVLVGVWHDSVGKELEYELQRMGRNFHRVYGGTPPKMREAIRNDFNAGNIDGIIGQLSAMGTAWNLQELCKHVIIAQDYYSAAIIEQFYKRVYRRGQKNKVQLDFITSNHAIDDAIERIRHTKATGARLIMGDDLT